MKAPKLTCRVCGAQRFPTLEETKHILADLPCGVCGANACDDPDKSVEEDHENWGHPEVGW